MCSFLQFFQAGSYPGLLNILTMLYLRLKNFLKHTIGNLHVGKRRGAKTKVATKYVFPPTQSLVLKQMDPLKTLFVNNLNFVWANTQRCCMYNFTKTFLCSICLYFIYKLYRPKFVWINIKTIDFEYIEEKSAFFVTECNSHRKVPETIEKYAPHKYE